MKLRIVRDKYLGYEVQAKRWWWPFWIQADYANTFSSVEKAEAWARLWAKNYVVKEIEL